MVLVDSSVWIEYLSHRVSLVGERLEILLRPNNQIFITGIIFQEILQGIYNQRSYLLTQKLLGRLPFLIPDLETHLLAATLFRKMVGFGKTPTSIDVLIASLAIRHKIRLFTLDKDFQAIQEHSPLQLF